MSRKRIAAMFAAAVVLAAAGWAVVLLTTGSSSGGPSKAACKQAMEQVFKHAMTHPDAPDASEPAACKGLPDQVLKRLAGQVMREGFAHMIGSG